MLRWDSGDPGPQYVNVPKRRSPAPQMAHFETLALSAFLPVLDKNFLNLLRTFSPTS